MRRAPAALAVLAAVALGACGDDEPGADRPPGQRLVVSAAASLTEPLRACRDQVEDATVRLSFAGSDELAAQIRQGVKPDVFAAANARLPQELAGERLLREPVAFATNQLVIAVPADSRVRRVEDLARKGLELAVGAESVPAGSYTRDVLGRLDPRTERRIIANVRTEEPDVKGVLGKVVQGAADAGFVYASDVAAVEGKLRAIALPARLRPTVAYGAGVVVGAKNPRGAQLFVDGLTEGPCADALRAAGFGPPPAP